MGCANLSACSHPTVSTGFIDVSGPPIRTGRLIAAIPSVPSSNTSMCLGIVSTPAHRYAVGRGCGNRRIGRRQAHIVSNTHV